MFISLISMVLYNANTISYILYISKVVFTVTVAKVIGDLSWFVMP